MARATRDEVIARLDIEAFYEAHGVRLNGTGSEYAARCPFHNGGDEKIPSFSINKTTGVFYCHACTVTGSPIDFLILEAGLDPKDKKNFRTYFDLLATQVGLGAADAAKEVPAADTKFNALPEAQIASPPGALFALPPGKKKAEEDDKADRPPIEESVVDVWHERLLSNEWQLKYLLDKRGITVDTVKRFKLGWTGDRYAIPVRDSHGVLVNIRKYKPEAGPKEQKMVSYSKRTAGSDKTDKYGEARLMPMPVPKGNVLLCEGEMDCILAIQEGFQAVTATSGAGHFSKEWAPLFSGREVVIAFDKDEAGRKGADSVARLLVGYASSVSILKWPDSMPEKGDVTDFLVFLDGNSQSLLQLVEDAVPYVVIQPKVPPVVADTGGTVRDKPKKSTKIVALSDSSLAEHAGNPIKFRGLVSGKDTAPFIIPKRVQVNCGQEYGPKCAGCGFSVTYHGTHEIMFDAENRKTLGLKDCADVTQRQAIAAAAKITVKGCPFWRREIVESQNLEVLSVIPEINGRLAQTAEGEYVTRTIDVLAHGIRANNVYDFEGYAYPDVKFQRATTLVETAQQVEVSIDTFELSGEQIRGLKVFQPGCVQRYTTAEKDRTHGRECVCESVSSKLYHIATEMSRVTRVWGREDLQVAYDLSFHSVLGFNAFGENQPRGWVELFVVGDSGQGKTTMFNRICEYYRAGQRVNAEQTSGAGLIGGLTKMGDRWQINWGPLVLNDRKLLGLDEFSGINEEVAKQMTDIRSTGIAEIIKIHREKAWARTRLVFMSNPKNGRTIGSYEHGVEALTQLFKEAADIRRLDLAITVATGDVSVDRINSKGLEGDCSYTSDDCANLVLWAWSRKPHQIQFEEGFENAVYDAVKQLAAKYSPKIPLIEPADERWKLARVAIAAACREFSTEDGVNVIVKASHVRAVVEFMDRVYSAPSMGYNSYSSRIMAADRFVDQNGTSIKRQLKALVENPAELINLMLTERYISIKDMEAQLGVERQTVKNVVQFLTKMRCIERTAGGYRKKPAFITILKEMEEEGMPPAPGDLFGSAPPEHREEVSVESSQVSTSDLGIEW